MPIDHEIMSVTPNARAMVPRPDPTRITAENSQKKDRVSPAQLSDAEGDFADDPCHEASVHRLFC